MLVYLVLTVCLLGLSPCRSRAVDDSVVSDYTPSRGAPPSVYSQIASNLAEKVTQPIFRFLGINQTTTKRPFEHIELDEHEIRNNSLERDVEELSETLLKTQTSHKPEKITLFPRYEPFPEKTTKQEAPNKYVEELEDTEESRAYDTGSTKLNTVENTETKDMSTVWYRRQGTTKPNSNLDLENTKINRTFDDIDNQTEKNVVTEDNDVNITDGDDLDDGFSFDDDDDNANKQRGPFIYFLELVGSVVQLLWGAFLAMFSAPITKTPETK